MRPLLHSDLRAAARALLAQPEETRKRLCTRLVQEADWADRYTRKFGKPHALWGTGTLESAAYKRLLAREPYLDDAAYCSCCELVLQTLSKRRATNCGK